MKIKNKCALVLGATRGIGLAVARELAAHGVRLALPWFDWPEDSKAVRAEFSHMEAGHLMLETDLRDSLQVREMVGRIAREFGGLHILVNNIERGGMPVVHGSYEREVNRGQWQVELETTLHAKWLVFEHCLPLLQKADQAAVVNISSIAGAVGRSGPAGLIFNDGYAAANRGIFSLTETWARIGAPTIRVNEIMLGLIDTRHGRQTRGWKILAEKDRAKLLAHTLLGRTGTPEEVAGAVMFLVRDANFMTGSVIRLDGGYLLGGEAVPTMPDGVV